MIMSKKEEKAKEFTNWLHKEVEEYYGRKCNPKDMYFRNGDISLAFESGWDEALKNQWISVKERLPEIDVKVLTLHQGYDYYDVRIMRRIHVNILDDNSEWRWSLTKNKYNVIAWMPIPSFDEILETNKDVLKRLKDK